MAKSCISITSRHGITKACQCTCLGENDYFPAKQHERTPAMFYVCSNNVRNNAHQRPAA